MPPKISIILTTARPSFGSIIGYEKIELFAPTIASLERQSFAGFELVIVDALHHLRPERFSKQPKFAVKHVAFTKQESRWLRHGMWNNVQMRNKGIIYADGELVVFAADCSEFSPRAMELYWTYYQKGMLGQAVFQWCEAGKNIVKKDHRWLELEKTLSGQLVHSFPGWFYEYSSMPMNLLLRLNGFDENFDGVKALEDVEIAMRANQLGQTRYVLDSQLYVNEYLHHPLPEWLFNEDHAMRKGGLKWNAPASAKYTEAFKDAYAIMMFNERHHRWKANTEPLTDDDLAEIKEYSDRCFEDGTLTGNRYLWEQSPHYRYWLDNQPVFDLKERREERLRQES